MYVVLPVTNQLHPFKEEGTYEARQEFDKSAKW